MSKEDSNKSEQQASKELVEKFQNELSGALYSPYNNVSAKQCAIIAMETAEKFLTEYGLESEQLQNMDSFFRYTKSIKSEILKM